MTENRAIEGTAEESVLWELKMAIAEVKMTRNTAIQGTAEQSCCGRRELWKLKMAQDDTDSVDGIIITSDDPTPKGGPRDRSCVHLSTGGRVDIMVSIVLRFVVVLQKRKMATENPGKVELPQPEKEGRFMRRKRSVEVTAEEAGFRGIKGHKMMLNLLMQSSLHLMIRHPKEEQWISMN